MRLVLRQATRGSSVFMQRNHLLTRNKSLTNKMLVRSASVLPDNDALSETNQMLRETVAAFAENELAPNAGKVDKECKFPMEMVSKMGELGLMGLDIPTELGGAG